MPEIVVTLSEDMVKFLEGLYTAQEKIKQAAEHIVGASEALTKLGLTQPDVIAIIAARVGVTKTAVGKILQAMRRADLDVYEILAMYIATKENVGRDQARRTIRCLMELVAEVQKREALPGPSSE